MPPATTSAPTPGAIFDSLVASIDRSSLRDELDVRDIPAPTGLAPYAIAFAADVNPARHADDSDLGTGRIVILYDPEEPEGWGGPVRVVAFAQAPLETEIGLDPFVADVATKVLSTGYGELAEQGSGAQLELRASWSPLDTDLRPHVEGWAELLCMVAGYPPAPEGVAVLPPRRASRD